MCLNAMLTWKENGKAKNLMSIRKLKLMPEIYKKIESNNLIEIKCGHCKECLREKMLEMKNRIKKELQKDTPAYFLTLTYDEDHKKELNKRDIQLFLKRYRQKQKLRYLYVGEIGEKTKRPHYHMIVFSELPKDLKECMTKSKKGYKQYESEEIQKLWKNGLIRISKMELPLIGYITKYMLKNSTSKEFIMGWSKNPPIGINEETIEEDIKKTNRTKALKKYYKKRYGEIPENENEIEQKEILIKEIEKDTPYLDYIMKKKGYKW